MNRRDLVLNLLDTGKEQTYIPAGFFLHFDPSCHRGQAAVEKHLEFFHFTEMDFVKIQYEHTFPHLPEIVNPEDWAKMPFYKKDFYEEPLKVVEGLVKAAKKDALVIVTLYSPFMCAGHTTSEQIINRHIQENPSKAKKGIERIAESLLIFVRECIRLGVDGFYASTQGGESYRFTDPALFLECIKPADLMVMEEINRKCIFNVLHVCDYHGGYADLSPFLDYPGQVVNCSLRLGERMLTGKDVSGMFGRPYMGGVERKGIIASGSPVEIQKMVRALLDDKPEKTILAADCTLPGDVNWENIRSAIRTAHEFYA
jgi:uroporphyrinogen decarboxylase